MLTRLIATSLAAAAMAGAAAQAPRSDAGLVAPTPATPEEVVGAVRKAIADTYVLPERRPALDAVLAQGLASGRYGVDNPGELAERINADLARVGQDRHLNFNHDPRQAAMLAQGRATGPEEGPPEAYLRQVRANNHGLREMRLLPGNIRYLDYQGFEWIGSESAAAIDTAVNFLKGGDAVIIDLRRNGGGSPDAVQYLISHFLAAGTPLVTFHMGGRADTDSNAALAQLPAGRMVGKPLYVLTSDRTGSAAEEFVGHVAGYRLGEVVGGNTGGAGFRNELFPIPGGYVLSVSVGRAVLASTGKDWEKVGIAPTMKTPIETALDAAQAHALRRLAGAATDPREKSRLEALADVQAARLTPRNPALPLRAYAGEYGERSVSLVDGRLRYRRGDRPASLLVPIGDNAFAFDEDPSQRLVFAVVEGRPTAISLGRIGVEGQPAYPRTR